MRVRGGVRDIYNNTCAHTCACTCARAKPDQNPRGATDMHKAPGGRQQRHHAGGTRHQGQAGGTMVSKSCHKPHQANTGSRHQRPSKMAK